MGFFDRLLGNSGNSENIEEIKALLKQANPNIKSGMMCLDITVRKLSEVLSSNEKIEFAIRTSNNLSVCTNERFIFIKAASAMHADFEDLLYSNISALKIDSGIGLDILEISLSGHKIKIEQLDKKDSQQLCNFLRNKTNQVKNIASSPTPPTDDVLSQLERLAKLREQGILSEDEFVEQKKRILV